MEIGNEENSGTDGKIEWSEIVRACVGQMMGAL